MCIRDSSKAIILVFAVNDRRSFESLPKSMEEVREFGEPDAKLFLVGNKIDLDGRVIDQMEAQTFADTQGATYLEVSARIDFNIKELFYQVTEALMNTFESAELAQGTIVKLKTNAIGDLQKDNCASQSVVDAHKPFFVGFLQVSFSSIFSSQRFFSSSQMWQRNKVKQGCMLVARQHR
eukprot:TRINITY_DN24275_c0_g1_i2.p1 TRINITY_DN24275_c0_g1~~TRINITY_DN24275_c0_g1_i2.p1  ORF type:complete len:198 (-),score=17.79 TRINITY_DN24275_c0_g1_i2:9-545(-)